MKTSATRLFIILCALSPAIASEAIGPLPMRHTLTDSNGQKLEATILAASEDGLKIRRDRDGKEFVVPAATLSKDDQILLHKIRLSSNPVQEDQQENKPSDGQGKSRKAGEQMEISIGRNVKVTMIWCPPGVFTMGCCPISDPVHESCAAEQPVTLTKGFWIGKTEVTQKQWVGVMESNPSNAQGDDLPVERINWNDAQAFVDKINASGTMPAGWKMTLPTSAQWEYACRAGTSTDVNNGMDLAYVDWKKMRGLSGMTDPTGPASGENKITHGGSFLDSPAWCTPSFRSAAAPDTLTVCEFYTGSGLRLAMVQAYEDP